MEVFIYDYRGVSGWVSWSVGLSNTFFEWASEVVVSIKNGVSHTKILKEFRYDKTWSSVSNSSFK